jgi:Phosphodiester glycosidase
MLPTTAAAQLLVPGVTHSRERIFNGGRPVVLHIVRAPPPSDLYQLLPVRARGGDVRRETVPAMQRRLSSRATTVGVNGDFFNIVTGHPTGVFMREGVISAGPNRRRSAMAVGLDGRLLVELFGFDATWQAEGDRARSIHNLNHPVEDLSRVGLFTRTWGAATPRARGAVELVLSGFPRARLDADLTGTVAVVERGGRTPIPARGAVLQARGDKRPLLLSRGTVGTEITVRMHVPELPAGTLQAIGGGPTLVRDGRVVRQSGQGFSSGHTHVRHPRTAVGQLANGRLLFVVADGRSTQSFGLTTRALATIMANRGAVTAISLDGGGSSTMAFEGRVLNVPSDGRPRRVANGLLLHYYGIFAPAVNATILSPNGDGVGDRKTLSAKVVRRSDVTLRLRRPDGSVAWRRRDVVGPRWIRRRVGNPGMVEGVWRWEVEAVETGTGQATDMHRVFRVDKTLGHLRFSRSRMWVKPRRGGRLGVSVTLTRRARLQVLVLGPAGNVSRALYRGELGPDTHAWRWNGKSGAGKVIDAGTYAIRITARNQLGAVSLRRPFNVLRAPRG